jgi:hypothetical protein
MIFAREITGPLTSLVKKIDAATGEHSDARMGSFVVFLNDDENMEQKLKDLAKKEKLQHTVLSLMPNPAGPTGYNVNKEADVTVVLYNRQNVKVNHAYKKGELKEADVSKILDELPKILPPKK